MKKYAYIAVLILVFILASVSVYADDTDSDGLDDGWEIGYFGNLLQTSSGDFEPDGLTNLEEFTLTTNPKVADTDGDTYSDWEEAVQGSNPNDANSIPAGNILNITLIKPKFVVSPVKTFELQISTQNSSQCKYSASPNVLYDDIDNTNQFFTASNGGKTHTISDFRLDAQDNFVVPIYVKCRIDSNGFINDNSPYEISLSVDTTPPKINSLYASPNPVIENLDVDLIAVTDDPAICKYFANNITLADIQSVSAGAKISDFNTTSTRHLSKDTTPKIEDKKSYLFHAICMNRAEQATTADVNFSVDLSISNRITQKSPSGYINVKNTQLKLVTNKLATCKYGQGFINNFPQSNTNNHYIDLTELNETSYSFPVLCTFSDAGTLSDTVSFTVDTTPPSSLVINSPTQSCSQDRLSVSMSASETAGNISGFDVRLVDALDAVLFHINTVSTNVNATNLSLAVGSTYSWEVSAFDRAGNNLTERSSGTTIFSSNDTVCLQNQGPRITVLSTLTENGISVRLECIDNDGVCANISYLVSDSASCTGDYQEYDVFSKIIVSEESTLCYTAADNQGTEVTGSRLVKYEACTSEFCCLEQQGYVCEDSDCTLVEDVQCVPENKDTDLDGMPDFWEEQYGFNINVDDSSLDKDEDGLANVQEYTFGSNPTLSDTDADGYTDKEEFDANSDANDSAAWPTTGDLDNDRMTEGQEKSCGTDRTKADADEDYDQDGLTNYDECVIHRTNALKADTDGDGFDDKKEVDAGTAPANGNDYPNSHLFSIILLLLGLGLVGFGAVSLSKKSASRPSMSPNVDFSSARQQLSQQQPSAQKKRQGMKISGEELDREIKKKREQLRLRKMSSVFDEFAESSPRHEQKEDVFEEIDRLRKKKGN